MTASHTALLLALLAACSLRPYTFDSATGDTNTTTSTTATSTSTSIATTTAATTTAPLTTTSGEPDGPSWRGVYRWATYLGEYPNGIHIEHAFWDLETQQYLQLHADEIPEYCAAAFGPGLYLEVAGVLHPDGADSDFVDEIDVTEFLAAPCRMADFHGTIDRTACAPWPDVCDYPSCDVWTQDCPEGQKCMPWSGDGDSSWESLKCVPVVPGAGGPGDPCTADGGSASGHDTCAKGHMCWDLDDDTAVGTCVPQCTGAPDAAQCPEGTTCTIAADAVLALCFSTCSPLAQDCEPTEVCLPNPVSPGDFKCVLDASGLEGQVFDPCEYDNACDPGLVCVGPELASECDPQVLGCCLPFCDLTQPSCPGVGQQCLAWYEQGMAPPGNENIGLCGLPP